MTSGIESERIRGVIFDMDGVLVNSEPAMYRASILGLRDYGIEACAEDFKPFVGTGENSFIGNVVRMHGGTYSDEMKDHVYAVYCRDIDKEIVLFDGVPDVIRALHSRGYHISVASAADKVKVDANIRAAHIPVECFDAVIKAGDVELLKPHPDIFLAAAKGMGLSPSECIVVEDAVSGVQAAKAAKMQCLGITSSFDSARLMSEGADDTAEHIKYLLEILK